MKLPEGFLPTTLSKLLTYAEQTNFKSLLVAHLGDFEDVVMRRIESLEARKLVQFATFDGEPAVFTAPVNEDGITPYQSATEVAFKERLASFWDVQGQFNAHTGQIESAHQSVTPDAADLASIGQLRDDTLIVETPQGPSIVISRVVHKLLTMGLLTLDAQGVAHAPSKTQLNLWTSEHGICDFCSDPHPSRVVMVPDFSSDTDTTSVGGWAVCETCNTLIEENRRSELYQRALAASSGGRFTAAALKGLQQRFWNAREAMIEASGIGTALLDFIEDRIAPEKEWVNPKLAEKARRQDAIKRLTGLTTDELTALEQGDVTYKDIVRKLAVWRKRFGTDNYAGAKKIAEMLNEADRPLLPGHLPHWQIALDKKAEALRRIQPLEKVMGGDVEEDVIALKAADVYSFNADTMHAIQEGAQSIPHESTLKSVEIPTVRAGWFWFADPLPVLSVPTSSTRTHALLWTWATEMKTPTLRFSAYVVDEHGAVVVGEKGAIFPSTKWYWPIDLTFHEMIGVNKLHYDRVYGPGSPAIPGKETAIGWDVTGKAIGSLSLFFLMSCLWFRQTVPGTKKKVEPKLTQTPGHIERHARKRYEKEFKATPTVHVIALRKSAVSVNERTDTPEGEKHHLHVRFIVRGHARLQACGPGMKDRKLIWVDPYPKGPEDAPFKDGGPRVFAVIR